MARHAHVSDGLRLSFECPKCGKKTEQTLTWLKDHHLLPCGNCGHGIDLNDPKRKALIESQLREAARVQAALTQAGDGSKGR